MSLKVYNTVLAELIYYSNDIIENKIVSCLRHKQGCQRFINDLKKMETDEYDYYWDEEAARKVVKWYSKCKHSKGPLEGKPIILNSWQKFVVCNIESWKHKDTDNRRFRYVYIQVARKNSKSQLEAGMASYECGAKGYAAAEIYTLGVEREQAKIVFDEVDLMLTKPLKKKFDIIQTEIRHKNSKSFIRHLSKKAGKTGDGKNPQMAIVDEYHAHPDSKMYDVMKSGMMAREEPLIVIISTAGLDYEGTACYSEYLDCCNILDDVIENEAYFVMICELEKDDNPFDPGVWPKANPVLCTYPAGIKSMADNAKLAKESVDENKLLEFKTKNCNIWVAGGEKKYLDIKYWKKCQREINLDNFVGKDCYIGIDLSKSGDLTSCSFEFPFIQDGIRKYLIHSHSFIPDLVVKEKMKTDNANYDLWIRNELLTSTTANEGLITDYWEMIKYIEDLKKKYNLNIRQIGFDAHNASMLVSELENRGFECIQIAQSCAKLDEATVSFRDLIKVEQIVHDGNKLLTWSMNNCETDSNSFGEIKISKKSKFKRIDPVASSIFAHKLGMQHWNEIDLNKQTEKYLEKMGWL